MTGQPKHERPSLFTPGAKGQAKDGFNILKVLEKEQRRQKMGRVERFIDDLATNLCKVLSLD